MFDSIKRMLWKASVEAEFNKLYGVPLRSFIGAGEVENLLNIQWSYHPSNLTVGAQNMREVLAGSYGIDVRKPADLHIAS